MIVDASEFRWVDDEESSFDREGETLSYTPLAATVLPRQNLLEARFDVEVCMPRGLIVPGTGKLAPGDVMASRVAVLREKATAIKHPVRTDVIIASGKLTGLTVLHTRLSRPGILYLDLFVIANEHPPTNVSFIFNQSTSIPSRPAICPVLNVAV